MAYTYHIALTGTAYEEFVPSIEPKVTHQEYAGEIFLRPGTEEIKISGLLNPDLYASLRSLFFDNSNFGTQLKFLYKRDDVTEYAFRSSISNAKIDTDRKLFMITPEPDDAYQDVLDYYDTKYNNVSDDLQLAYAGYIWQRPANAFVNVDFTTFADVGRNVTWTNTTGSLCYARIALSGYSSAIGGQIKVVIRNLTYNAVAPKIRVVNGAFAAISDTATVDADGLYTITFTAASGTCLIELEEDSGGGSSAGEFDYDAYYYQEYSVTGNYLENVINRMLALMETGNTCHSTYLFNDAVPSLVPSAIDTYITANPTYDYATQAPAIWNYLWFGKTDSLTTDNADNYELSFKELMEIIKIKLRAYWYIDSEGYFRIEHEKYFREWGSQLDLTSATHSKYKPETDMFLYDYQKTNIVNTLTYQEQNEGNDEFIAFPIRYDPIKTTPGSRSLSPPKLSTDIGWIYENPGDADANGFILMQCDMINSTPVVGITESELTDGVFHQNGALAWSYLFVHYWQYFAEGDSADINNGDTLTPTHIKEFLNQSGVRFYYGAALNWYQPVLLTHGTAWIKKIEHDLNSGFYTIDVGFSPTTTADSTTVTADSTLITADTA